MRVPIRASGNEKGGVPGRREKHAETYNYSAFRQIWIGERHSQDYLRRTLARPGLGERLSLCIVLTGRWWKKIGWRTQGREGGWLEEWRQRIARRVFVLCCAVLRSVEKYSVYLLVLTGKQCSLLHCIPLLYCIVFSICTDSEKCIRRLQYCIPLSSSSSSSSIP